MIVIKTYPADRRLISYPLLGPMNEIPAALCFYRALRVYPSPVELIMSTFFFVCPVVVRARSDHHLLRS